MVIQYITAALLLLIGCTCASVPAFPGGEPTVYLDINPCAGINACPAASQRLMAALTEAGYAPRAVGTVVRAAVSRAAAAAIAASGLSHRVIRTAADGLPAGYHSPDQVRSYCRCAVAAYVGRVQINATLWAIAEKHGDIATVVDVSAEYGVPTSEGRHIIALRLGNLDLNDGQAYDRPSYLIVSQVCCL